MTLSLLMIVTLLEGDDWSKVQSRAEKILKESTNSPLDIAYALQGE
jgi:hypothetical protein